MAVRRPLPFLSLLGAAWLVIAAGDQPPDERPASPQEWGFRPANGTTVSRNPPPFSWRPQAGAVHYELQASRDASFQRVDYSNRDLMWNVHCPAEIFEPGEWTWRFRVIEANESPRGWSSGRRFTIPQDARLFPLPPKDKLLARIPREHPRLFLRPEDLPRMVELAKGSQKNRFEELVKQCEGWLASPPSTEEPPKYPKGTVRKSEQWRAIWWGNRRLTIGVLDSAATLAFTWRLGGGEEYGQLARRLLMDAARWDPKGATGYRYNDEAGMPYAYYFARTYTFVYPLLSDEDRALCRRVMSVRGREMYEHLAPRHLWQPYSSHSNRAWHFLGEVGIAFHGEIPEAADWIDFAVNVFANVYPVWSDADGGWHEGTAYWRSYLQRFTWWADVQKAALGLDAYQLPFFSSAGDYAMYLMPPGTKGGGFGDQNAKQVAAGNRKLMTVFAAQSGNPYWRWYVDQIGGPDLGGGYVGFLRSALPEVEARPPNDLATSRLFRGTGQAVLGTTLSSADDNVEVIFKSSPFGTQSHGYESQNSFLLYAFGERLLIRSGIRDIYGSAHHTKWMWRTRSVNNITLGGTGQTVHNATARGEITDFHTEPGWHFVEGEAREAYGGRLETFRRRILLIEPDIVLIVDRLRAKEPTPMDWLLHAPTPFNSSGPNTYEVNSGKAACRIRFLTPEGLTFTQTDQFDPPPRERIKLTEHHLTASIKEPTTEALFLTLIRPFRVGQEPPDLAVLSRQEGKWKLTARLSEGTKTIIVDTDGSVSVRSQ